MNTDRSVIGDLQAVLRSLGMEGLVESWRDTWEISGRSYPARDEVFFLQAQHVRDVCQWLTMGPDVREALLDAAAVIRREAGLRRLAWHVHWLVFQCDLDWTARRRQWPMLPQELGDAGRLFYAVVFLGAVPALRAAHNKSGVPETVTVQTLADLELWIREYRNRFGVWGFNETWWLTGHLTSQLFHLGRLQFQMEQFDVDMHVFQRHTDGKPLLLAGNNMRFRSDGQFANADGLDAREGVWQTTYRRDERSTFGYPIAPTGRALHDPVELPTEEWEERLGKGDRVLGIHIPATGAMDHQACGASFQCAKEFFSKHFPEYDFRAFTCESWLLDPQLECHLPEQSNIVRFLREFYLFPFPGASAAQTIERVFGGKAIDDWRSAPQRTSLQRIVAQHVLSGGRWRSGGGLILVEGMDWGSQTHRVRWD